MNARDTFTLEGGEEILHDNQQHACNSLRQCVDYALEKYFILLEGNTSTDLYKLVITEVEAPLLEAVMRYTRNNQSKAADMLGLNRGTLRKKLKQYDLL